jgi:NADH-quinone oxidoreductase subunit C
MANALLDLVSKHFGDAVLGTSTAAGDAMVLVRRERLLELMTWLRDDAKAAMNVLVDVTVVDFGDYPPELRSAVSPLREGHTSGLTSDTLPRFEVVYHLLSMTLNHRLRVKCPLAEDDLHVPSMTPLWIAANWGEREAWDMYGVRFDGHPDPRRILLYDEFEGHPLRKDFPLRGYQPLLSMPTLNDYEDNETRR